MRIRTAFCALIGVLLITVTAGCTSGNGAAAPAASASGAGPDLPAGWRWESYGGVEVGVPGDWGWDNASQRLGQWCVGKVSSEARPVVGRPGIATDVGCPGGGTVLADTGTVVGFNRTEQADGVAHEGDRTTVRLDTVEVVVQAPAELRQRIVETIRRGRLDSNGCPSTQVISTKPQWRPGMAAKVESLRDVAGVSVCKYQLGEQFTGAPPRLISSTRLDGAAATRAVSGVAAAPVGGGPNDPTRCSENVSYGDEVIVLRIRSSLEPTHLVIRYSGCDHNGFDDGFTVRKLTTEALAPFITGPHALGIPVVT